MEQVVEDRQELINDNFKTENPVKIVFRGKHDCNVHACISPVGFQLDQEGNLQVTISASEQDGCELHIVKLFTDLTPDQFIIDCDSEENSDAEGTLDNDDGNVISEEREGKRGRLNELNETSKIFPFCQDKQEVDVNKEGEEGEEEDDSQEREDEESAFFFVFPDFPDLMVQIDEPMEMEDEWGFISADDGQRYIDKIIINQDTAQLDENISIFYSKMAQALKSKTAKSLIPILQEYGTLSFSFFNVQNCWWKKSIYTVPIFPSKWLISGGHTTNFNYVNLDEIVINDPTFCIALTFPLTKPITFQPKTREMGHSLRDLFGEIAKMYDKIYSKENDEFREEELCDRSKEIDPIYLPLYQTGLQFFKQVSKEINGEDDFIQLSKMLNCVYLNQNDEEDQSENSSKKDDQEEDDEENEDTCVTFQTSGDPALFIVTDFSTLKIDHFDWYSKNKVLIPRFDASKPEIVNAKNYIELVDAIKDFEIIVTENNSQPIEI